MQLKDSELEILLLLKKHGKLRWEDLVKDSGFSRRWVHKSVKELMKKGLITREQDKASNEYPSPVYYSIANLPREADTQLQLFEVTNRFLKPYHDSIKFGEKLTASVRSIEEFSASLNKALKAIDEVGKSLAEMVAEMEPLSDDLRKAVESGELPKEILEVPIDEAVRTFFTYKVEKGELPPTILELPLGEAIQKYRSQSMQKDDRG